MNAIDRQVSLLLLALQESPEYRNYRQQEEILRRDPELKKRVDRFRRENYNIQTSIPGEEWAEATSRLAAEGAKLRRIPQVNDFLDAELDLCRLIQRTVSKITSGIAMDIPL